MLMLSGLYHLWIVLSTFSAFALSTSTCQWDPHQFALRISPASTQDVPSATIPGGTTYIGTILKEDPWPQAIEAFRGIPYTLPPTGDRRFREAMPIEKTNETVEAKAFGPRWVASSDWTRTKLKTVACTDVQANNSSKYQELTYRKTRIA